MFRDGDIKLHGNGLGLQRPIKLNVVHHRTGDFVRNKKKPHIVANMLLIGGLQHTARLQHSWHNLPRNPRAASKAFVLLQCETLHRALQISVWSCPLRPSGELQHPRNKMPQSCRIWPASPAQQSRMKAPQQED